MKTQEKHLLFFLFIFSIISAIFFAFGLIILNNQTAINLSSEKNLTTTLKQENSSFFDDSLTNVLNGVQTNETLQTYSDNSSNETTPENPDDVGAGFNYSDITVTVGEGGNAWIYAFKDNLITADEWIPINSSGSNGSYNDWLTSDKWVKFQLYMFSVNEGYELESLTVINTESGKLNGCPVTIYDLTVHKASSLYKGFEFYGAGDIKIEVKFKKLAVKTYNLQINYYEVYNQAGSIVSYATVNQMVYDCKIGDVVEFSTYGLHKPAAQTRKFSNKYRIESGEANAGYVINGTTYTFYESNFTGAYQNTETVVITLFAELKTATVQMRDKNGSSIPGASWDVEFESYIGGAYYFSLYSDEGSSAYKTYIDKQGYSLSYFADASGSMVNQNTYVDARFSAYGGGTIYLYPQYERKRITITWVNSGDSNPTTSTTKVYPGDPFVPPENPTRKGYVFKGYYYYGPSFSRNLTEDEQWAFYYDAIASVNDGSYIQKYTNTGTGTRITNAISCPTTQTAPLVFFAYFTLKSDINVTITKDLGVLKYDYVLQNSTTQTPTSGVTLASTTIYNQQAFTVLSIFVDDTANLKEGFVWDAFVMVKGVEGVDYDIYQGSYALPYIYLTLYNNIEIRLTSCVAVVVYNICNDDGYYKPSTFGGYTSINDVDTIDVMVKKKLSAGAAATLTAYNGTYGTFRGYTTSYDAEFGAADGYISRNKIFNISSVETSLVFYAIFEVPLNDLYGYSYGSKTNVFTEQENNACNGGGTITCGDVTGKIIYTQKAPTKQVIITAKALTGFIFVGWYSTLEDLQSNNELTCLSTNTRYEFKMPNKEYAIFAKFVKVYTLSIKCDEGIDAVSFKTNKYNREINNVAITVPSTGADGNMLSISYKYGEIIDDFMCVVNQYYKFSGWQITYAEDMNKATQIFDNSWLTLTSISSRNIVMPDIDIELTAYALPKFYKVTLVSVYSDNPNSIVLEGLNGNNISISFDEGDENASFDEDGNDIGVYSRSAANSGLTRLSAYLKYNRASSMKMVATPYVQNGENVYEFYGWFATYSNGFVLDPVADWGENLSVSPINRTGGELIYYAYFKKSYRVTLKYDTSVRSVTFKKENSLGEAVEIKNVSEFKNEKYVTFKVAYGTPIIATVVTEHIAELESIKQNNITSSKPAVTQSLYKLEYTAFPTYYWYVTNSSYDLEFEIKTEMPKYALEVKAVFYDNYTIYEQNSIRFEDCGEVSIAGVEPNYFVRKSFGYGETVQVAAKPKEGYVLWGWVRKNGAADTKTIPLLKSTASLGQNFANMIDTVNHTIVTKDENDRYTDNQVIITTDPIDTQNNLYIAIFVKLYEVKMALYDDEDPSGVSKVDRNSLNNWYFNYDGTPATITEKTEETPLTITLTLPYGQETSFSYPFDTMLYIFSYWEVLEGITYFNYSGNPYVHVPESATTGNRIKASNGSTQLTFYVYGNTVVSPYCETAMFDVIVNIYSEISIDNYQISTLGGRYAGYEIPTVVRQMPYPSSYHFFDDIIANPGYSLKEAFFVDENGQRAEQLTALSGMKNGTTRINIYFQKDFFAINVYSITANDSEGNFVFPENIDSTSTGGIIYASQTKVAYAESTVLAITAIEGYKLIGVYRDKECKVHVNDLAGVKNNINNGQTNNSVFHVLSDRMGLEAQNYYALFAPSYYVISTYMPSGFEIDIKKTADYGENVTFNLSYTSEYIGYTLLITHATNTQVAYPYSFIENGITFEMPANNILVTVQGIYREVNLTFDANGGNFISGYVFGNVVYGVVNCKNNNYKYFTDSSKQEMNNGAPKAAKLGYEFLGYSLDPEAKSPDIITFGVNNDGQEQVTLNAFEGFEDATLYAIYAIQDLLVNIETVNGGIVTYSGGEQEVLKAVVQNQNTSLTYTYAWFSPTNPSVILSTEPVLKLRSTNQSGVYNCRVAIEGMDKERTVNATINIIKKVLKINIDDGTYIGGARIYINNRTVSNLSDYHSLESSSYLVFPVSPDETIVVYDKDNKEGVIPYFYIKSVETGEITQDGQNIADNYDFELNCTVTIIPRSNTFQITAGLYERTVNTSNLTDQISENVMRMASLSSMEYTYEFLEETISEGGCLINYLMSLNGTLKFTFTLPQDYEFYAVVLNDKKLTTVTASDNTISFPLISSDIGAATSLVDIKICLTRECLVNLDYNMVGVANDFIIQTNGHRFVMPPSVQVNGFTFVSWCYDEFLEHDINSEANWDKTGNVTIYGKWSLDALNDSVQMIVKDDGNIVDSVNREYNGTAVEVSYIFDLLQAFDSDIPITYEVKWYKLVNAKWTLYLSLVDSFEVLNVVDSGEYSLVITAIYDSQRQSLPVGVKTASINITECSINISEELEKQYDGTNILTDILIDGAGEEKLMLYGELAAVEVSWENGEIVSVPVHNYYLLNYESSLGANYVITNENLRAKIIPYEYVIELNETVQYAGQTYINNYVVQNSINQTISYNLYIENANVGTYTQNSLNLDESSIQIFDIYGETVNVYNYNISFGECEIIIEKAHLNFVFVSQVVDYDGNEHMIKAVYYPENATEPEEVTESYEGVVSITYTNNGNVITGFTDAGSYKINVYIETTDNFYPFETTATLTINRVEFSVQFVLKDNDGNAEVLQKYYGYNGIDIYNKLDFIITSNNMNVEDIIEINNLQKVVMRDGTPVRMVEDIARYQISISTSEMDYQNFTVIGATYANFEIVIQDLVSIVNLQAISVIYDGSEKQFLALDQIQKPDIFISTIKNIRYHDTEKQIYTQKDVAKDAGEYVVEIGLTLIDDIHYKLSKPSVEVKIIITPFTITADKISSFNITKVYDGLLSVSEEATLEINLTQNSTESIGVVGVYASANVDENVNISDISLKDTATALAQNYILDSGVSLVGSITPAELNVSLLEDNAYLEGFYSENYSLNVTAKKSKQYLVGLVNKETIEFTVICYDKTPPSTDNTVEFPLRSALISTENTALIDLNSIKVYNQDGEIISGGINNYEIKTTLGGIKLYRNVVFVEILEEGQDNNLEFNNIYDGNEKTLYFKYTTNNGEKVYKYNGLNLVNILDESDVLTETVQLSALAVKNAGKYQITLTNSEGYFYQSGSETITLSYDLMPKDLSVTLGSEEIEFLDTLIVENVLISGINGEQIICSVEVIGSNTLNLGSYEAQNDILKITHTGGDLLSNYNISFVLPFTVIKKAIYVNANYDLLDITYNTTDQIGVVNAVELSFTDRSQQALNISQSYFLKQYILNSREVTIIKDAGDYLVYVTSDNFTFIQPDGRENTSHIFGFTLKKKVVNAVWTIESGKESFTYNKQDHKPASVQIEGLIAPDTINNITIEILYSNDLPYITDAGTYQATVNFLSGNYELSEETKFSPYIVISPAVIYLSNPTEVWFTKYYGEQDPVMVRQISTSLNDIVFIEFTREENEHSERIGNHSVVLNSTTLSETLNPITFVNNYVIDNSFNDLFGAFEILARSGSEGKLTISVKKDLVITYSGNSITNISYHEFLDCFDILDYSGAPLDSSLFAIEVLTFKFSSTVIKNVGEYQIYVDDFSTSTHDSSFVNFIDNGYKFKIVKKTLSFTVVSSTIIKQYDKTSRITFDDTNIIFPADQVAVNDDLVIYGTAFKNNEEISSIGSGYDVKVALSGLSAQNYTFGDTLPQLTCNIVKRELTVSGVITKEYSADVYVNINNLTLNNTLDGDNVTFYGIYADRNVGEDIAVTFVLSNFYEFYTIIGNYVGDITKKQLYLTDASVIEKPYDASPQLTDLTNVALEGVEGVEDVYITSVMFVNENGDFVNDVGTHNALVTLSGRDSGNYYINTQVGEIKHRLVTLMFHYGETPEYLFGFVNDGNTVEVGNLTQATFFGLNVQNQMNTVNYLPSATRTGYNFIGWTTDKEHQNAFNETVVISLEAGFNILTIIENGDVIDLYANWEKAKVVVEFYTYTELLLVNGYQESLFGGNYSINGTEQFLTYVVYEANYYDQIEITLNPENHFEIDAGFIAEMFSFENNVALTNFITEPTIIEIKFNRERIVVSIDLDGYSVKDFDTAVWSFSNGLLSTSQKFETEVILPLLTTTGASLKGYAVQPEAEVQFEANEPYKANETTTIYAIFNAKQFSVKIDHAGGVNEETGSSDYSYVIFTYGKEIPELPVLKRSGYIQEKYELYNVSTMTRLSRDVTEIDVFLFDSTNTEDFVLFATWSACGNKFIVEKKLDSSVYSGDYATYTPDLSLKYKVANQAYALYQGEFYAGSGDAVELQYTINNTNAYTFVGWEIDGKIIASGTSNVNGVNYYVEKNFIRLNNFEWGEEPPAIIALYKPVLYALQIDYNSTFGFVNILNGGNTENPNSVYAGSILEIDFGTYPGYEFLSYEIVGAEYMVAEDNDKKLTIFNILNDVSILFDFDLITYDFAVVKTGIESAFSGVYYSVNNKEFALYTRNVRVVNNDYVKLRFLINNGYKIKDDILTISRGSSSINVELLSTKSENTLTEFIFAVTGFTDYFEITAEAVKKQFNINLTKYVLNDLGEYKEITENDAKVLDQENNVITSANYLDVVTATATAMQVAFEHNNKAITIHKYEFLGWYNIQYLQLILISNQEQTTFVVNGELNIYAVFELSKYTVSFDYDSEKGELLTPSNAFIVNPQTVLYGDDLPSVVKAIPASGYKFVKWQITYNYKDANSTVVVEDIIQTELSSSNLKNIKADVVCSAMFDTIDVTLNLSTKFVDATANDVSKATVRSGSTEGSNIVGNTKTRTRTEILAVASKGYVFNSWDIKTEIENFVIISNVSEQSITGKVITTLVIEFTGSLESYEIVAQFEKDIINITVGLQTEKEAGILCGIVLDLAGVNNESNYTFSVKMESVLTVQVYIFKGFNFLNGTASDSLSITPKGNTVISVKAQSLTPAEQKEYSAIITLTIKDFNEATNVLISLSALEIDLAFAQLIDFETQYYVENVFIGTVVYGTKIVTIPQEQTLTPEYTNCDFIGWSFTVYEQDIVINSEGKLINYWDIIVQDATLQLYPIFKNSQIKIVVSVNPENALVNKDTFYADLFNNANGEDLIIQDGEYFFKVGTNFGLSLPEINDGYTFLGFSYYIVNSNNNIQRVDLFKNNDIAINFASSSLFSLNSSKDYKYNLANNSGNYPEFENLCFYVSLVYEIELEVKAINYFGSENRISIAGGDVSYSTDRPESYILYGDQVTLRASVSSGYDLVAWRVNGVDVEETSNTFICTITEATKIEAVFKGKLVKIALGSSEQGSATGISGGNSGLFDGDFYQAYVGDSINLSAEGTVGYDFTSSWQHSNGLIYESSGYFVVETDANVDYIVLTPIFKVRDLTIKFEIIEGEGSITVEGVNLITGTDNGNLVFIFQKKYFDDIEVTIVPGQKNKFGSISLNNGSPELIDLSANVGDKIFRLISSYDLYNNARILTFYLSFNIEFWHEYLIQEGYIIDNGYYKSISRVPFMGSGTSDDPYKIETAIDLAMLSSIINNGIELYGTNMPFNGSDTYYEIAGDISMIERYWTPIGTIENPFNAKIFIYIAPANLTISRDDPTVNYDTMIDHKVLQEYGGLIGYLSNTGTVEYKTRSFSLIFIVIGSIVFLILLIIVIVFIVRNMRQKKIEDYNSQQEIFK